MTVHSWLAANNGASIAVTGHFVRKRGLAYPICLRDRCVLEGLGVDMVNRQFAFGSPPMHGQAHYVGGTNHCTTSHLI